MKWATADWHLNHEEIIHYCNRPFNRLHRMNSTLIQRYNKTIEDGDDVYFLGDLTIMGPSHKGSLENFMRAIPKGNKYLILGNHDKFDPFVYVELGFRSVHTYLQVEEFHMTHDPAVCQVANVPWLCGHIHTLFKRQKNVVNVGVDVWEFFPVSFDELRKEFQK